MHLNVVSTSPFSGLSAQQKTLKKIEHLKVNAERSPLLKGAIQDKLELRGEDESKLDSFKHVAGRTIKAGAIAFGKTVLASCTFGLSSIIAIDLSSRSEKNSGYFEKSKALNNESAMGFYGLVATIGASLAAGPAVTLGLPLLPLFAGTVLLGGAVSAVDIGAGARKKAKEEIERAKCIAEYSLTPEMAQSLKADHGWLMS